MSGKRSTSAFTWVNMRFKRALSILLAVLLVAIWLMPTYSLASGSKNDDGGGSHYSSQKGNDNNHGDQDDNDHDDDDGDNDDDHDSNNEDGHDNDNGQGHDDHGNGNGTGHQDDNNDDDRDNNGDGHDDNGDDDHDGGDNGNDHQDNHDDDGDDEDGHDNDNGRGHDDHGNGNGNGHDDNHDNDDNDGDDDHDGDGHDDDGDDDHGNGKDSTTTPTPTPTPTITPGSKPAPQLLPPAVLPATFDLSISKSDDVDPAYVGDTVTYTITVRNKGDQALTGLVLQDTLAGGMSFKGSNISGLSKSGGVLAWSVSSLAAGKTQSFRVSLKANRAGDWLNTVSVRANELPAARQASERTRVLARTAAVPTASDADPASANAGSGTLPATGFETLAWFLAATLFLLTGIALEVRTRKSRG